MFSEASNVKEVLTRVLSITEKDMPVLDMLITKNKASVTDKDMRVVKDVSIAKTATCLSWSRRRICCGCSRASDRDSGMMDFTRGGEADTAPLGREEISIQNSIASHVQSSFRWFEGDIGMLLTRRSLRLSVSVGHHTCLSFLVCCCLSSRMATSMP